MIDNNKEINEQKADAEVQKIYKELNLCNFNMKLKKK